MITTLKSVLEGAGFLGGLDDLVFNLYAISNDNSNFWRATSGFINLNADQAANILEMRFDTMKAHPICFQIVAIASNQTFLISTKTTFNSLNIRIDYERPKSKEDDIIQESPRFLHI